MDSARFRREYEAEFAEEVDIFLPQEWVDRAVEQGINQRPPLENVHYIGTVDPAGSGAETTTLCVAHAEGQRVVIDLWSETLQPEAVASGTDPFRSTAATVCRSMRLRRRGSLDL